MNSIGPDNSIHTMVKKSLYFFSLAFESMIAKQFPSEILSLNFERKTI